MSAPARSPQHGIGKAHIHAFGPHAHFNQLSYTYPLRLLAPTVPFAGDGQVPVGVAYMLSYGGGLCRIELEVKVEQSVGLVFLTQGSTKVFKSRMGADRYRQSSSTSSHTTTQYLTASLASSNIFVLLPDPITCFQSASYTQVQTFHLSPSSSLVLLDWFTSGRMARGEEWVFERYYSRNEIWIDGKRVARDVMLLTQEQESGVLKKRTLKERLSPYACYATLFLIGTLVYPVVQSLQTSYGSISQRQRTGPEDLIWSLSPLVDGDGVCVRIAGKETELVREWLKVSIWTVSGMSTLVYHHGDGMMKSIFILGAHIQLRHGPHNLFPQSYNVAPQTNIPVIMQEPNGQGQQEMIRWGIRARWCDPNSFSSKNPINARSEVVLDGSVAIWKTVRGSKHCIVVCDGYYEWLKRGSSKTPYYVKHPQDHLLLLAGFYEIVRGTDPPKTTYTCTILTTEPNSQLSFLHDRMPIILSGEQALRWLDVGKGWQPELLEELRKPYTEKLVYYEVPSGVGKAGAEDPSFVEPIAERKDGLKAMMSRMVQKQDKKQAPKLEPSEIVLDYPEVKEEDPKVKVELAQSKTVKKEPFMKRELEEIVLDDDSDIEEDTTRTKSEPKSSPKSSPVKRRAPSKRGSSPIEIDVSSGSEGEDNRIHTERKRRKVDGGSSPLAGDQKPSRPVRSPNKKTIMDFFGKK
ncbi:UreD urease accessory protein [Rhizoctonia solani]|uniref:UreD urease accessory protein n=1 Tax=Rhizoctonia solani TaxID=456999 RepID=A0A8H7HBS1_9AGAM|nr:UreD urease accessory protein [Rhizoctonia solani]